VSSILFEIVSDLFKCKHCFVPT